MTRTERINLLWGAQLSASNRMFLTLHVSRTGQTTAQESPTSRSMNISVTSSVIYLPMAIFGIPLPFILPPNSKPAGRRFSTSPLEPHLVVGSSLISAAVLSRLSTQSIAARSLQTNSRMVIVSVESRKTLPLERVDTRLNSNRVCISGPLEPCFWDSQFP